MSIPAEYQVTLCVLRTVQTSKCGAKFRAEVAKESARNEKIAKKSLKAKSRAYVPELSVTKLRFSGPASGRCRQIFGAVAREAEISHSDSSLLLFDPEIERTLCRARQARRRAELARLASDNNPFDWSNSDSDSDT
ncbi:hypothetical protein PIB30_072538 [Stylosanthes scabra]|uniref:Uncharacterized protein n=1 Tax=Stylosanthes scabra TaxID=79078 RepID=A0ABU6QP79_9FABA|nr:hypothetical protein [Stylosanthes scabra]